MEWESSFLYISKIKSDSSKYPWWTSRTKIEKCLLAKLIVFAIAIICLTSILIHESLQQKICMSEKCIQSAANILGKIDRNVSPCEDFYRFACGNFLKEQVVSPQTTFITSMSGSMFSVLLKLMKVFEEPLQDEDTHSLKLLKTMYSSCMNTTKIEKEGLDFVKKAFKEYGGWPVIEQNNWNEEKFNWISFLSRLRKDGWKLNFLFLNMYVGIDYKNSSKRILTITKPYLAYDILKNGFNHTWVKAGHQFSTNLAVLFGADQLNATAEMKEVMQFIINMAKIEVVDKAANVTLNYNPITIRALQENFSSIAWLEIINNFLSPVDVYTFDDVVNFADLDFFYGLEDLLNKTDKKVLANYMFLLVLIEAVAHLPEEFRRAELEYHKIVYGISELTPRWQQCVFEADMLHLAVSATYVRRFVNKSVKPKVTEMIADIKRSFIQDLREIEWMDQKTKKAALLKAEKMHSFVAYPEQLLDDKKVEEYYKGLELAPDQYYLKNSFNLSLFFHKKSITELKKPVTNPDWHLRTYSYVVNSFYQQNDNAIDIPAGILQEHFFDPERPQYLNYGVIGFFIGHEITHGFDNIGRQYDNDGNLVDWWDPETSETFVKQSQCFVEQYGNETVTEIEMNLNGAQTLAENIADNGGVNIAYKGYLEWLKRNGPEPGLPGLTYTPRQLYWIALAQNFCTKYKNEAVKQQILFGVHSPNKFRVMMPLINSDYFGSDFNCPLGSPMNPKSKCGVW